MAARIKEGFGSLVSNSSMWKEYENSLWFRRLRKWRAGIESGIGTLKRKYGLRRSLFDGNKGTKVWVGLGIFAHNIDKYAASALGN